MVKTSKKKKLKVPKERDGQDFNFLMKLKIEKPSEEIEAMYEDIYSIKFNQRSGKHGYIFAAIAHPFVKMFKIKDDKLHEIASYDYDRKKEQFYSLTWCSSNKQQQYNILACAGTSGNIFCINALDKEGDFYLKAHGNEVSQLVTHPTKSYIVAASSNDLSISLVNVETRVLIAKLAGLFHQYHIFDVAFKDDGNEILSSDQSQKICAWSLDSKDIKKAIETSENMTLSNQKNKEPLIIIEEPSKLTSQVHEHEVDSISYLFDDYIVSKSSANEVICWKFAEKVPLINGKINIAVETPVKVMKNIRYADISIKKHRIFYRFGIDKKNLIFVITSMNYGEFYSYEFGDSQLDLKIQKFPELLTTVRMFNFSPDGKYLIAGTASREIFLFSSNYFSYINN